MRILYLFEYIVIVSFFFIRSLTRSIVRVAHYKLEYKSNGIVGNNEL